MNLTISGHHVEVTPAIREYVQSKLERVRRHFDQVIDIAVILTVDKLRERINGIKQILIFTLAAKIFMSKVWHTICTLPSTA